MAETKQDLRTRTLAYGSPAAPPTALGPKGTIVSPARPQPSVGPKGTIVSPVKASPPTASKPIIPLSATDLEAAATIVDAGAAAQFNATVAVSTEAETLSPAISARWTEDPVSVPSASGPTSGRVTVLPRFETVGTETRIVRETRLRYVADKKLGEGGVGEVLGAVDQDIGRRVAVKRLHQNVRSEASLLRFADEVRTIGRLEHPNIIPIHDVGVDERGDHYFVMKYVDGETIESIIAKLAEGDPTYHALYTVERRVEIFLALLEAVAFAHSNGIIHRDIKPANVMVGAYGEVVLMDWGVAKIKSQPENLRPRDTSGAPNALPILSSESNAKSTMEGGIVGTPFYMSPEQSKGLPVDERSDVYALTLLFYEFLGLVHPLEGKAASLDELLKAVAEEPVPPISALQSKKTPTVPAELFHFLRHGLEKDPAKRYQSVDEMIMRLRARAAGDIPIECPVTFMKQGNNRWRRFVDNHPYVATSMMFVGMLGALGFASLSLLVALGVLHH